MSNDDQSARLDDGKFLPDSSPQIEFLFRKQCLSSGSSALLGTTNKHFRKTFNRSMTFFTLIALSAITIFLLKAQHARTVTVKGIITPQEDVAHLASPTNALIEESFVHEGDLVVAGERLFRLSKEHISRAGRTFDLSATKIKEQLKLIDLKKKNTTLKGQQLFEDLKRKRANLISQKPILVQELAYQAELVKNKNDMAERFKILLEEGAASVAAYESARHEALLASTDLQKMKRGIHQLDSDLSNIQPDILAAENNTVMTLFDLENESLSLSRDLLRIESDMGVYVTAPITGSVSALNTSIGQSVATGQLLASIYPANSVLEAHLFIPPEGIGFVETGQDAAVHLTAFPFQKFGVVKGRIARVSRTPYQTIELPHQLLEVLEVSRTYYKVIVELDSQTIKAHGENRNLKPGLALEADLILETRNVYEWLMAPLYSFTRKTN